MTDGTDACRKPNDSRSNRVTNEDLSRKIDHLAQEVARLRENDSVFNERLAHILDLMKVASENHETLYGRRGVGGVIGRLEGLEKAVGNAQRIGWFFLAALAAAGGAWVAARIFVP